MPSRFFKSVLPLAAIGLAVAASGCSWSGNMGGFDGVPLSELDTGGAAPTGVMLAGPDKLVITEGKTLTIDVEGDADDELRFRIEDGVLGVGRENSDWGGGSSSIAIIRVTMPALESLEIAGSGEIDAAAASGDVAVDIAGSGEVAIASIAAQTLSIDIAGSGKISGSGTADELELSIAGSGDVQMEDLQAGNAAIDIAGSGDAIFSSDGTVKASIAGSGDVTVIGNASCSVDTAGSGSLNCRPRATAETDAES